MDVGRLSDLGNDEQEVGLLVQVLRFSASVAERIAQRPYEVNFASSIELSRSSVTTSPLIQPTQRGYGECSRVGQRSGAAVQATQMPFSCTTLPSSSMRPPKRRSLTMSQWIAETFVPPMSSKPRPSARWMVPFIFSSK